MMYYNKKWGTKGKFNKKTTIVSVSIAIAIIIGITAIKANFEKNDYIYMSLLQYSMPVIKNNEEGSGGAGISKFSIGDYIFNQLSFNIFNVSKVVSKEVPLFSLDDKNVQYDENGNVKGEFTLSDDCIIKLNPGEFEGDESGSVPIKISPAYNPKLKKTLNNAKPEVLIYHSHTWEAFKPAINESKDEKYSVVSVGDYVENELEQNYGISVIHDTTIHCTDYPNSYKKSAETVKKYLQKYGDFKLVIDIHRDSGPKKSDTTINLNGENVAKIMFVYGKNNSHYQDNANVMNKLNDICENIFKGFSRGFTVYKRGANNSFNQNLSENSILIEVGTEQNTIDEANASAKYIARVIAEYINGKN